MPESVAAIQRVLNLRGSQDVNTLLNVLGYAHEIANNMVHTVTLHGAVDIIQWMQSSPAEIVGQAVGWSPRGNSLGHLIRVFTTAVRASFPPAYSRMSLAEIKRCVNISLSNYIIDHGRMASHPARNLVSKGRIHSTRVLMRKRTAFYEVLREEGQFLQAPAVEALMMEKMRGPEVEALMLEKIKGPELDLKALEARFEAKFDALAGQITVLTGIIEEHVPHLLPAGAKAAK